MDRNFIKGGIKIAKYQELADSIIKGDNIASKDISETLVNEGTPATDVLNQGLMPGMNIVGKKFKAGEMYIPEVLMSARAMHAAMDIIKPLLTDSAEQGKGSVAIGTVRGDLHDIGKNLVGMMLEGGGYNVVNLGVDVSPETFVETVKEKKIKLVGLSALLTTTMPSMKDIIDSLRKDPETSGTKVMVGGAPLTEEYADSIGADGYAPDAASAVDLADNLI